MLTSAPNEFAGKLTAINDGGANHFRTCQKTRGDSPLCAASPDCQINTILKATTRFWDKSAQENQFKQTLRKAK